MSKNIKVCQFSQVNWEDLKDFLEKNEISRFENTFYKTSMGNVVQKWGDFQSMLIDQKNIFNLDKLKVIDLYFEKGNIKNGTHDNYRVWLDSEDCISDDGFCIGDIEVDENDKVLKNSMGNLPKEFMDFMGIEYSEQSYKDFIRKYRTIRKIRLSDLEDEMKSRLIIITDNSTITCENNQYDSEYHKELVQDNKK